MADASLICPLQAASSFLGAIFRQIAIRYLVFKERLKCVSLMRHTRRNLGWRRQWRAASSVREGPTAEAVVELNGIEPMTSGLQSPRSPS